MKQIISEIAKSVVPKKTVEKSKNSIAKIAYDLVENEIKKSFRHNSNDAMSRTSFPDCLIIMLIVAGYNSCTKFSPCANLRGRCRQLRN